MYFVEIERNRKVNDNIMEMLYGIGKLSKMESFKFRYHKDFTSREANIDNLQEMVPIDANTYVLTKNPISENAEKFFSKTPIETLEFINETIFIKKPFADVIHMQIIDFDTNDKIMENINETFDVNAFPEILFCPTGGINQNNAHEWLSLKNVICVGGSWIIPPESRDYKEITKRALLASSLSK